MSRARPKPPVTNAKRSSSDDAPADVPPPGKHPWLLGLSGLLLAAWMAFMAYLAWGR